MSLHRPPNLPLIIIFLHSTECMSLNRPPDLPLIIIFLHSTECMSLHRPPNLPLIINFYLYAGLFPVLALTQPINVLAMTWDGILYGAGGFR